MSVYFFDTETTSRDDDREIIEAALVHCPNDGGDLAGPDPDVITLPSLHLVGGSLALHGDAISRRFKPSQPITFGSIAVHGILPEEIANCEPSASFRLPDDCAYLIGHSVDFDWQAIGSPAHVKRICTFAMSQHVWPDKLGHSLVSLIYRIYGATPNTRALVSGAHSALHDCHLTVLLLNAILFERPTITRWSQLWQFSEDCRIPRTCPMKRYEGVPLEELDEGFVQWCLNQPWLDPYFRIGLERVIAKRYGGDDVADCGERADEDSRPF